MSRAGSVVDEKAMRIKLRRGVVCSVGLQKDPTLGRGRVELVLFSAGHGCQIAVQCCGITECKCVSVAAVDASGHGESRGRKLNGFSP